MSLIELKSHVKHGKRASGRLEAEPELDRGIPRLRLNAVPGLPGPALDR
jgi:hypothetical protein